MGGFDSLAEVLSQIQDSASFQALMATRPDLFDRTIIEELHELETVPGLGEAIRPFLRLLEEAQHDPKGAWRQYQRAMEKRANEEELLAKIILRAQALAEKGEYDAAIELAESTSHRPMSRGIGFGAPSCTRSSPPAFAHGAATCELISTKPSIT